MVSDSTAMSVISNISDSASDTTKISLVFSVISNLVMSGPMDFIWGLVNSLQIVTHYPLVNVMMPSNAYNLFKVIVEISDL